MTSNPTVLIERPGDYMDLAILRKQHDRMVSELGHPITFPPNHAALGRAWGTRDPATLLTASLRHYGWLA